MSSLLRFFGPLALITASSAAAFSVGCSANTTEDEGSSTSDITGSLANAQACAIRDTYRYGAVSDFHSISANELPFTPHTTIPGSTIKSTIYARITINGIGAVYYVEQAYTINVGDDDDDHPTLSGADDDDDDTSGPSTSSAAPTSGLRHAGIFFDSSGHAIVSNASESPAAPTLFYLPNGGPLVCSSGSSTSSSGISSSSSSGTVIDPSDGGFGHD